MLVHSSPGQHRARLGAWITDALARGEKVLYEHGPTEDVTRVLESAVEPPGSGPAAVTSGQLELIDTARVRARSGGGPERLRDLHAGWVDRTRRAGYAGVALTGDAPALRALTCGDDELVAHERDLDRLVAHLPVRALCRYDTRERSVLLAELVAAHAGGVDDVIWNAVVQGDRLCVYGELDASNVDRFAEILRVALKNGVSTVDLSGVGFLSAAGGRVLRDVVDRAGRGGPVLVLNDPARGPARILDLLGLAYDTTRTPDRQRVVDERA